MIPASVLADLDQPEDYYAVNSWNMLINDTFALQNLSRKFEKVTISPEFLQRNVQLSLQTLLN